RPVDRRPYDFRPEPPTKTPRRITEPWRLKMKARPQHSAIGYVTPNEAEEIFYTILNDGKKAA
ncbi:hypothetical protein, partial [Acidomonas methanolica]|uniref:hypothetical protein n=1 Tax=Acidomonas methanolica TaxID=437 RepID=UPI00223217DD